MPVHISEKRGSFHLRENGRNDSPFASIFSTSPHPFCVLGESFQHRRGVRAIGIIVDHLVSDLVGFAFFIFDAVEAVAAQVKCERGARIVGMSRDEIGEQCLCLVVFGLSGGSSRAGEEGVGGWRIGGGDRINRIDRIGGIGCARGNARCLCVDVRVQEGADDEGEEDVKRWGWGGHNRG